MNLYFIWRSSGDLGMSFVGGLFVCGLVCFNSNSDLVVLIVLVILYYIIIITTVHDPSHDTLSQTE